MRRAVFFALALALPVIACGKKGMPPECDKFLVKYDCFLTKSGMSAADKAKTLDGMRETWSSGSKTATGRTAILAACNQMDGQMVSKFKDSSCN
jgi:hypothetical protein